MSLKKQTIRDIDLANKTVVVRLDLNVPISDGVITDDLRISQSLPTLQFLLERDCKIVVLSHLSRVKSLEDKTSGKKSLAPVAKALSEKLVGYDVSFCPDNYGLSVSNAVSQLKPKQVLVLENTRYLDVDDQGNTVKKESKNDQELGKFWASLGDVFINDAFGTAHRAHASNAGVGLYAKESAIGFLVERELLNLSQAVNTPEHPYVVILGGAKVSDKLRLIKNIIDKVDYLIIGGGMCYTFHKAQDLPIGKSLCDESMIDECKKLVESYPNKIILPVDHLVNSDYSNNPGKVVDCNDQQGFEGMMGLDIGPKSIELFTQIIEKAKTIVWNGPMGVFEFDNYANGTKSIAQAVAKTTGSSGAFSLIGGGDSAAAFKKLITDPNLKVSFISTGGGASLSFLEGSELVGLTNIKDR